MDVLGEPPVRHDHFLSGLVPKPRGPPGIAAVGDDVMAGGAHQPEIVKGAFPNRFRSHHMDIRSRELLPAPTRIIREYKKTRPRNPGAHLCHGCEVIAEVTNLEYGVV